MRVLVTGTEGYLGSLLAPLLIKRGHDVVGVDTGFYKEGWLYRGTDRNAFTLDKDIRAIDEADLAGVDAVVHMAELSNDPVGALSPTITYDINHEGSVRLAKLAKAAGVERFVYTSSCSVYGVADGTVDETSPVDPQTAYAECKAMVERDVGALADDSFSPTFLRNATAFGASPRMRFDIVLNNLAGLAWTTGEIAMTSDGTPWRPLVHALDIGQAIALTLEAPRERVHGEVMNVGSTEQNYRVREVAEIVSEVFTGCKLSFGAPSADNRSYRVSFDKIHATLPDFSCDYDVWRGAQQLHDVFARIDMPEGTFEFRAYTRLKQLQHLLRTRQIDERFFWGVIASIATELQVPLTLLVGVLTGILSGMFGIGGAVVSTPAIRALGATPLEGVGSTLPSIIPSSITATLRYHRDGFVRWDVVKWVGAFGVLASVGGSLLAEAVPGDGHLLMLITAGLVAFTAYRTAFPRAAVTAEGIVVTGGEQVEWWRLGVIGIGAGGLSGLLGVGGGILMVPAFSTWARLPLKDTIATSLAVVGLLAIPGTITHALLGHIAWRFAIPLSIGVIPGARIGAHLTISTSERKLRIRVGAALGAIAVIYAAGEILALA